MLSSDSLGCQMVTALLNERHANVRSSPTLSWWRKKKWISITSACAVVVAFAEREERKVVIVMKLYGKKSWRFNDICAVIDTNVPKQPSHKPCNIVEREFEAKMRISKQHSSLCFGHSRTQHSNYPTIVPRCAETKRHRPEKISQTLFLPHKLSNYFWPSRKTVSYFGIAIILQFIY